MTLLWRNSPEFRSFPPRRAGCASSSVICNTPASRAWAQTQQMVPGVQAGRVAVGPVNPHGVIADQLHVSYGDIGRYRLRIHNPRPRILIDARRAVAVASQEVERIISHMLRIPCDPQNTFTAQCLEVLRKSGHLRIVGFGASGAMPMAAMGMHSISTQRLIHTSQD